MRDNDDKILKGPNVDDFTTDTAEELRIDQLEAPEFELSEPPELPELPELPEHDRLSLLETCTKLSRSSNRTLAAAGKIGIRVFSVTEKDKT